MCKFLSAIITRNGQIICDPEHTDSHEDLLAASGLFDGNTSLYREELCRVEFTPPEADLGDLNKWTLTIDEQVIPSWADKIEIRAKMEKLVERIIIRDTRKILLGSCWILLGDADVKTSKNSRIYAMNDSSKVGVMRDSSKVEVMCDSSKVEAMYDSSTTPNGEIPTTDCR